MSSRQTYDLGRPRGASKREEPPSLHEKMVQKRNRNNILLQARRAINDDNKYKDTVKEEFDELIVAPVKEARKAEHKPKEQPASMSSTKPVKQHRGGLDLIPGTPSTILNVSPWDNTTPLPTISSDEESGDEQDKIISEPITIPENDFHDVRSPCDDGEQSDDDLVVDVKNAKSMPSWRDNKCLADCILYTLTNQVDLDVTVLLGKSQEAVLAHSFMLSTRSANMEALLEEHKGILSKMIAVPEVEADVFKEILKYFYSDDIELTPTLAFSIIPATCFVGSRDLMQLCFRYLLSESSADIVCRILELAHKVNAKQVYYKCLHFIHSNGEEVLVTKDFQKLCAECVEEIVKSDDLNAGELAIFNALMKWADMQLLTKQKAPTDALRRNVLDKLLYHVRFVVMDTDEFTQNISKNEVLTQEEKLVLFQTKYHDETVLPTKFDKQPRRRRVNIQLGLDAAKPGNSSTPLTNNEFHNDRQGYNELAINKVIRFGDTGGSWHRKGPDAIRVTVSSPVILRGVQIFGPNQDSDKFKAEMSVFSEDKHELGKTSVEIDHETDVKVYEVLLGEPMKLKADETYTIQLIIKCKSTHCGTNGQEIVVKDDIQFEFKNSNMSFNGTDVTIGQIPAILYSITED